MIRTVASVIAVMAIASVGLTIGALALLWWTTADVIRHRFQ